LQRAIEVQSLFDELTVSNGQVVEWVPSRDRAALIATLLTQPFLVVQK